MHVLLAAVATGHPAIPTGGDFDFTPLLYAAIWILAFRKLRPGLLLLAAPLFLLAGGLVDSISDVVGLSTLTTASALALPPLLPPLPPPRPPPWAGITALRPVDRESSGMAPYG